jgi:hypothetical protein
MTDTNLQLTSTITEDNKLDLALREIEIPPTWRKPGRYPDGSCPTQLL